MEKTLTIDGKEVHFKSTAATVIRFKAQFGKDFLTEIGKLNVGGKNALNNLDLTLFYEIAWAFAKTADKTIPNLEDWLDEFEITSLIKSIPEIMEMITGSIQSKKK